LTLVKTIWPSTISESNTFLARGIVKGNRMCATVKVVEVDLDELDGKNGNVERERGTFEGRTNGRARVQK
jgi:hypothetical protein